jgi:glycosyltransferase involved in cell wall biosynthesis
MSKRSSKTVLGEAGTAEQVGSIVRVITRLNVGGPAVHTVLLTRELVARGYRTVLASGVCESDDGDMSYFLNDGDTVRWISALSRSVRPWNNVRALLQLWRVIRDERPTIVHTHTAMAGCVGRLAARMARVPIIVHTFHGNSLRQYFSPAASAVFLRIERWLANLTDAICVVSEQQAVELSQELHIAPRDRFRIVPLGIDLSPYLGMQPPEVTDGPLRVGWFGRLVAIKNPALLLAVIEAVAAKDLQVEFHVAGDGPARDAIEAAVRRHGSRMVWHGWQQDVAPLLGKCHALVQTSINEGTPLALIQGMAAARPFVSTPVGGVVDMVSGTGERLAGADWFGNGVLVPRDAEAFARVFGEMRRCPPRLITMGRNGRQFAVERHSKERLCEDLDALYRELIGRKLADPKRSRCHCVAMPFGESKL